MRKTKTIKVPTTGTFDFETLIKSTRSHGSLCFFCTNPKYSGKRTIESKKITPYVYCTVTPPH